MNDYDVSKDCRCADAAKCACPCHGAWRKARTLGAQEGRDWTPGEMSVLYRRGFKHGACSNAMDKQCAELPWYAHGYADGREAAAEAMDVFNAKVGYVPSVLRTNDFPITSARSEP